MAFSKKRLQTPRDITVDMEQYDANPDAPEGAVVSTTPVTFRSKRRSVTELQQMAVQDAMKLKADLGATSFEDLGASVMRSPEGFAKFATYCVEQMAEVCMDVLGVNEEEFPRRGADESDEAFKARFILYFGDVELLDACARAWQKYLQGGVSDDERKSVPDLRRDEPVLSAASGEASA